jgi:hypothetical protein
MQTIQISNVRQVLPPVTKANFKGFETEEMNRRVSNWGWAHLELEICPLIRVQFIKHGVGEWTDFGIIPQFKIVDRRDDDIFGRYGLLNRMENGKPLHTWTNMGDTTVIHGERPQHPPICPDLIYIPHVWAVNVIAAAAEGIVRVTSKEVPDHLVGPMAGSGMHIIIGHKVSGEKLWVLLDGSGRFSYVSPSEWVLSVLAS